MEEDQHLNDLSNVVDLFNAKTGALMGLIISSSAAAYTLLTSDREAIKQISQNPLEGLAVIGMGLATPIAVGASIGYLNKRFIIPAQHYIMNWISQRLLRENRYE